jgi:hypothetical protein
MRARNRQHDLSTLCPTDQVPRGFELVGVPNAASVVKRVTQCAPVVLIKVDGRSSGDRGEIVPLGNLDGDHVATCRDELHE